ncbi:hypothetical protein LIT25_15600 [Bacillus sp. F19]|nr:hypothetical protein LIT25_15600 [Bacillus sp. F19]
MSVFYRRAIGTEEPGFIRAKSVFEQLQLHYHPIKRSCLIESITKHLGEEFEIRGDAAGLHIIVQLPERLNDSIAIELAKSRGVEIDAVSTMYQLHKPSHQVMLGYGEPSLDEIQKGVGLLAAAWKNSLSN